MKYQDLADKVTTPAFYTYQAAHLFPDESNVAIRFQLSRLVKRQKLFRLKRGLYLFKDRPVDELVLANLIYEPSYVSLDKALNLYGIMPDVPGSVTSITTTTPNIFKTGRGTFSYSTVLKNLYFGFTQKLDGQSRLPYRIAEPEKAILDWIYVRKITTFEDNRFDLTILNRTKLSDFGQLYPSWVMKVLE